MSNRFRRFLELAELGRALDDDLLARGIVVADPLRTLGSPWLRPGGGFSRTLRALLISRWAVAFELARELRAGAGIGAPDAAGPS